MYCFVNTACGIGRKAGPFGWIKAGNTFDQANGADGKKVLMIPDTSGIFFGDMGDQTQIMFNELISGLHVPCLTPQQAFPFLLRGKRLGKGIAAGQVGEKQRNGLQTLE